MEIVSYKQQGRVATIGMDDGKANVLSPAMIEALNGALDKAESSGATVVLKGREGTFSGGFDLSVLAQGADATVALMQSGAKLSRRLLAFPTPVIAASSGHAVAMGAFLLLSCDYRIGLEGAFKYGLNEVAIGLSVPRMGIELAHGRLSRRYFHRAVMNAEIFAPDIAVEAGFLDQVVRPGHFAQRVHEQAAQMADLHPEAFSSTKLKARKALLEALDRALEQDAEEIGALLVSR